MRNDVTNLERPIASLETVRIGERCTGLGDVIIGVLGAKLPESDAIVGGTAERDVGAGEYGAVR